MRLDEATPREAAVITAATSAGFYLRAVEAYETGEVRYENGQATVAVTEPETGIEMVLTVTVGE